MQIAIREEEPRDHPHVFDIVKAAFEKEFGSSSETVLISKLRELPRHDSRLALVAVHEGAIVGHLLLFPVTIQSESGAYEVLSLGPMAVATSMQKQGIGSHLVKEGLSRARAYGYSAVVVLGHPQYYPRFGFLPASRWGIQSPFAEVPADLLFAMELKEGALPDVSGTIVYPEPFYQTL